MDVLVVGAGVAGLTLAAKLGQQGVQAAVVERGDAEQGGYAIGLYPLGSSVLHGLGSYDRLVERSLPVSRYELRDRKDRVLQALDMSVLTGSVGPMGGAIPSASRGPASVRSSTLSRSALISNSSRGSSASTSSPCRWACRVSSATAHGRVRQR